MKIMENIIINTEMINLDQLLKWAGIIDSGAQAKSMIDEKLILVNNKIVTERRKKIHPGDIMEITGLGIWTVIRQVDSET